jgi:hypothetical protein
MSEFSIQDAAFTGFRVVREHPKALAVWTLYALALSLVISVIVVVAMGPDFARLMDVKARQHDSAAETLALFRRLAPGYAMAIAVGLVSNSILGAAMIRAVLLPDDGRVGFLRLGADELRQLGLGVLTVLVFLTAYLGFTIVAGVVVTIVGAAMKAAAMLVSLILVLAVGSGMVFLGVRLSLAPALTFDRRRIDLFGSWTLTRGRFWPLFGTYLLTIALIAVVYLLCLLVIYAIGAVLGLNGSASAAADMHSVTTYFTPWLLIQTVLGSGASALVWPVLLTPPTAIYRALAPSGATAADVFS